jgi:hypothetical protein
LRILKSLDVNSQEYYCKSFQRFKWPRQSRAFSSLNLRLHRSWKSFRAPLFPWKPVCPEKEDKSWSRDHAVSCSTRGRYLTRPSISQSLVVSWSHFLVMSPRLNRNMCVIEDTQERPNEDRAAVATWPAPIKMQYSMRMSRHFRSNRRCHLKPPRLSLQETERTTQYESGISCAGSPPTSRARQLCAACISSCSGSFVQME